MPCTSKTPSFIKVVTFSNANSDKKFSSTQREGWAKHNKTSMQLNKDLSLSNKDFYSSQVNFKSSLNESTEDSTCMRGMFMPSKIISAKPRSGYPSSRIISSSKCIDSMGQAMGMCCVCNQISEEAHCNTCADDQKKISSQDNILHSIKKHKKCMIKGKIIENSADSFARNLAETLEIPDDVITNHYSFGKVIGLGQYGTVKEAFSITDESEKVAVKILDLKTIAKTFKSICCEVSSLQQANHPNIIKLLKIFMDKEKLYLVFEYVNGIDLSDYIAENIRIPEDKAVVILQQICNTIDYLHSIHICHRDIKLDNIMINQETLEIKLIDFGFATKFSDSKNLKGKIGTPYYK